ncbi:MAG TPA: GspH/FimT family pseudopilin [Steroidobacteraceae bacterium]|nr:GspH/FimT family pseudopilin [Steroidobacteraceae bacterium]
MKQRGFTLTELLAAMAISALLLGLAGPAFTRQRAQAALRSASAQTMAALHLARRLALARGQSVTVCPSSDGQRCRFGGDRWLLFANAAGGTDSRLEAGEELLRQWTLPAGVLVSGTRGYAAFQARPGAAATVTFEFRHRGVPGASRSVVVSQTGRPRLMVADFPAAAAR